MSIVQVSSLNGVVTASSTVNDGGTVVNAGNIGSDNPITNNRSLVEVADGGSDYGSKVVAQDGTAVENEDYAGVAKAKAGGTGGLAFFPNSQEGERNFLIRGAGTQDGNNEVNNDSSSLLSVPGSEVGVRGVAPQTIVVSTRQLGESASADGSTSTVKSLDVLARPSTAMVPGRTKGDDAGAASTFVNPADGTPAVSTEIVPSRAVPGELTYHFGGLAAPTTDEYKARDSYES